MTTRDIFPPEMEEVSYTYAEAFPTNFLDGPGAAALFAFGDVLCGRHVFSIHEETREGNVPL